MQYYVPEAAIIIQNCLKQLQTCLPQTNPLGIVSIWLCENCFTLIGYGNHVIIFCSSYSYTVYNLFSRIHEMFSHLHFYTRFLRNRLHFLQKTYFLKQSFMRLISALEHFRISTFAVFPSKRTNERWRQLQGDTKPNNRIQQWWWNLTNKYHQHRHQQRQG